MKKAVKKKSIIYEEGDLFHAVDTRLGPVVIPHIVNNMGAWGAGFVVPLTARFPKTVETYEAWSLDKKPKDADHKDALPFTLGETFIGQVIWSNDIDTGYVAHMLAQNGFPTMEKPCAVDYKALEKCMKTVADFVTTRLWDKKISERGKIYCPLFGAGIAGGDWKKIAKLIQKYWVDKGIKVTVFYMKDRLPAGWKPPKGKK